MDDTRNQLEGLDRKLGRAWAKIEIVFGLLAVGAGALLAMRQLADVKEINYVTVAAGLGLFVCGGYLALAGHRSHLYRWNNRNTVTLIDEIRHLHDKGQST